MQSWQGRDGPGQNVITGRKNWRLLRANCRRPSTECTVPSDSVSAGEKTGSGSCDEADWEVHFNPVGMMFTCIIRERDVCVNKSHI